MRCAVLLEKIVRHGDIHLSVSNGRTDYPDYAWYTSRYHLRTPFTTLPAGTYTLIAETYPDTEIGDEITFKIYTYINETAVGYFPDSGEGHFSDGKYTFTLYETRKICVDFAYAEWGGTKEITPDNVKNVKIATGEGEGDADVYDTVAIHPDELDNGAVLATGLCSKANVPLRLYPTFEAWGFPEKTITRVRIIDLDRQTNRIIFRGRVSAVSDVMEADGKTFQDITCVSSLDFFSDTAFGTDYANGYLVIPNYEPTSGYIPTQLIKQHNEKVENFRKFSYRIANGVNGFYYSPSTTLYCSRYDLLVDLLTDGNLRKLDNQGNITSKPLTLEFRETYDGDSSVLEIAEKFGQKVESPIIIGDNLRSIKVDRDTSTATYTNVIAVSGICSDGKRYRKSAKNDEMYALYGGGYDVIIPNDNIKCTGAVWDDSDNPTAEYLAMLDTLEEFAKVEASKLSKPPVAITIEAEDLASMGYTGYELFEVGNSYPVVCPPLGLYGQYMRVTTLRRRLCDGRIDSISLETGEKLSNVRSSASLTAQMARLDEIRKQTEDNQSAQTEISKTTAQLQTGGYTWISITLEDYQGMTEHDDHTHYVVSDGGTIKYFIGDDQITSQGGGGTLQTGVVITDEQGETWIPDHDLVPVSFSGSATVYYGGSPARIVFQGQQALWGVAAADIVANDIMSEVTVEFRNGTREKVKVYVAWENHTQLRLGVEAFDITGASEVLLGREISYNNINRSASLQIGMVIYVSELYDNGDGHLAPAYSLYLAVKPTDGTATLYTMPQAGQSIGGRNADFGSEAEEGYASGITQRTYPT